MTAATNISPVNAQAVSPGPGRFQGIKRVMQTIMSRPSGMTGVVLVTFHLLLVVIAPVIAPYDVTQQNVDRILEAPSMAHWMGTDSLGRDVLSRTILGGADIHPDYPDLFIDRRGLGRGSRGFPGSGRWQDR